MVNSESRTNENESIVIPRLLTAKEVADILRITEEDVNDLVGQERLGCMELTAHMRGFTKELVEEFIRAETVHRNPMWDEPRDL